MSYSCLEELQVDLDLRMLDKTVILSNVGCKYKIGNGVKNIGEFAFEDYI